MNILPKQYFMFVILLTCIFVFDRDANAEIFSCPSIQSIKNRTISKEFEWTVSENTSLDAVLNVSKLEAVSIENHGEFVSCIYQSHNEKVRLDAKPITVDCLVVTHSANWQDNKSGRWVCIDNNKMNCQYEVSCQIIQDGS